MSTKYTASVVGHLLHSLFLGLHIFYLGRYFWSGVRFELSERQGIFNVHFTSRLVDQGDACLAIVATLFCIWLLRESRFESAKSRLWVVPFGAAAVHLYLASFYFSSDRIMTGLYVGYHLGTWALLLSRDLGKGSGILLPYSRDQVQPARRV